MLKEILQEFGDSRVFSKAKLSDNLNVSEETIEDGIEQLTRMGYLKESNTSTCTTGCKSCPYANSCNSQVLNFYTITDRGQVYLNR